MVLFTDAKSNTRVTEKLKIALLVFFFAGMANFSFGQSQKVNPVPVNSIIERSKDVSPVLISKSVTKTEAQVKQEQAKLMKELYPNHPAYMTVKQQGAGASSQDAYELWKKNYPGEYAAYLKIFGFKYQ